MAESNKEKSKKREKEQGRGKLQRRVSDVHDGNGGWEGGRARRMHGRGSASILTNRMLLRSRKLHERTSRSLSCSSISPGIGSRADAG